MWSVGVLLNFYSNQLFVFKNKGMFLKYVAGVAMTLACNVIAFNFFHYYIDIPLIISILTSTLIFPLHFFYNKNLVFKA